MMGGDRYRNHSDYRIYMNVREIAVADSDTYLAFQ
jgi:hypothetical protein